VSGKRRRLNQKETMRRNNSYGSYQQIKSKVKGRKHGVSDLGRARTDRAAFVDRLADDVHDATEGRAANWNLRSKRDTKSRV
jgi:hypothetical protein